MDKNLENRIQNLEKQLLELQNSNTVPYNIERSFMGRGFLKLDAPPIFLVGADQGAWLNTGGGSDLAFPPAFAKITEGEFAGLWIPLYIPPSSTL